MQQRKERAHESVCARVCVHVGATCASSSRGDEGLSLKQIMKERKRLRADFECYTARAPTWPITNTRVRLSCNCRRVIRTEKHFTMETLITSLMFLNLENMTQCEDVQHFHPWIFWGLVGVGGTVRYFSFHY